MTYSGNSLVVNFRDIVECSLSYYNHDNKLPRRRHKFQTKWKDARKVLISDGSSPAFDMQKYLFGSH